MKLILSGLFIASWLLPAAAGAAGGVETVDASSAAIAAIVTTHALIEKTGYQNAIQRATWPKPKAPVYSGTVGESAGDSDNPLDDCIFDPDMAGCPISGTGTSLKNDGVQILSTEVLYQTLTFFKVKHVFGQTSDKKWVFKVIEPVPGEPFQDLDTDTVVGAMIQFRKYITGLLCDDPSPGRILAMLNRYDVGARFRWEMAWALLGNELPDSPNRFMAFGAKWRKFEMALDAIQSGSALQIPSLGGGGNGSFVPLDPGPAAAGVKSAGVGFIAREAVGILRLAGDIVSEILNLVCISDLSVNAKKEAAEEQAVYKLLDLKKQLYERYSPLQPVLDQLGREATKIEGRPVSFYPN